MTIKSIPLWIVICYFAVACSLNQETNSEDVIPDPATNTVIVHADDPGPPAEQADAPPPLHPSQVSSGPSFGPAYAD